MADVRVDRTITDARLECHRWLTSHWAFATVERKARMAYTNALEVFSGVGSLNESRIRLMKNGEAL
jgi:hypothetical protein